MRNHSSTTIPSTTLSSSDSVTATSARRYPLLSIEFLSANGVAVNKLLKNWVTRAAFLAKTRNTINEKNRYERWALYTIEQAISNGKGVDGVDWRKVSPIMPPDAPECHPRLLALSQNNNTELPFEESRVNSALHYSTASSSSVNDLQERTERQKIWEEMSSRAPLELQPFISQAFELYDKEVNQRKRSYTQVTMIEMLNIAKHLHKRTIKVEEQMKLENAPNGGSHDNNSNTIHNNSNKKNKNFKEKILQQVNSKISHLPYSQSWGQFSDTVPNTACSQNKNTTSTPLFSSTYQMIPPNAVKSLNQSTNVPLAPFLPTSESLSSGHYSGNHLSSVQPLPLNRTQKEQIPLIQVESQTWTPTVSAPIAEEENAIAISYKRQRYEMTDLFAEEKIFFIKASTKLTENEFAKRAEFATSQELERMYSRYEPKMEDIRSLPVLINAFDYVHQQASHKECVEGRAAGLKYLSDQLKGIRQDLRVQNIVNDFTICVYEEHAKLSLETGELGEFNQCQASLKQFYNKANNDDDDKNNNLNSSENLNKVSKKHCHISEFFQYRLFYLHLSQQTDALSTELINWTNRHDNSSCTRCNRTKYCEEHLHVMYVLRLCKACNDGNCRLILYYLQFFPLSMWFLLKIYLQKLRIGWLHEIALALRGQVSMQFILESLGFLPIMVELKLEENEPSELMLTERRESDNTVNLATERDNEKLHRVQNTNYKLEKDNEISYFSAGASHTSRDLNNVCWLDRSSSNALAELNAIFALVKLEFPVNFSFDNEVKHAISVFNASTVDRKARKLTPHFTDTFLDVAVLRQNLDAYLQFLNTRNDAKFSAN